MIQINNTILESLYDIAAERNLMVFDENSQAISTIEPNILKYLFETFNVEYNKGEKVRISDAEIDTLILDDKIKISGWAYYQYIYKLNIVYVPHHRMVELNKKYVVGDTIYGIPYLKFLAVSTPQYLYSQDYKYSAMLGNIKERIE